MIISHSREHGISCSPRYTSTFSWLHFRQQNAFGTVSLDVYYSRCLLQVLSASEITSRASIHNAGMSKMTVFLLQDSEKNPPSQLQFK